MQITIELPDELASQLAKEESELARKTLELLVIDAYQTNLLTKPAVEQALNLTPSEVDRLLDGRKLISNRSDQAENGSTPTEPLPTIAETFQTIRQICVEENFELDIPPRQDRLNPFMAEDVSL